MDDEHARQHGALTGESGVVTPPHVDDEFVAAERRVMERTEIEGAGAAPAPPEADPAPATEAPSIAPAVRDETRIDPQDDRY